MITFRHVTACVAGAAALTMGMPAVAQAQTGPPALTSSAIDSANAAARWLVNQVNEQGFVPKPDGTPNVGSTRQIALSLTGSDQTAVLTKMADWMAANLETVVTSAGVDVPGRLAELILIAKRLNRDPNAVGGSAAANHLVDRLLATQRTSGTDAGLFGAQDATYDGAYRQGWVLLALQAAGVSNAAGANWLLSQQCADGSWVPYRVIADGPCAALDPANYSGPDTNSTALAAIGLTAAGTTVSASTLDWFANYQSDDGGWAYNPGADQASDPDSTALSLAAVSVLGGDLQSADWVTGASPIQRLLSFQFGCDVISTDQGAFWFPPYDPADGYLSNVLATGQAHWSLTALPSVREAVLNASLSTPQDVCAARVTTTTTATTATAIPTPTTTSTTSTTSTTTTTTPGSPPTSAVKSATTLKSRSLTPAG